MYKRYNGRYNTFFFRIRGSIRKIVKTLLKDKKSFYTYVKNKISMDNVLVLLNLVTEAIQFLFLEL